LKTINTQLEGDEEVSEEKSKEIAEKWMAVADIDGSGTIDMEEFKEFLNKLDSTEKLGEDQIK